MPVSQGAKVLPAAGAQPVQITGSAAARSFILAAPLVNTGTVWIGGRTVSEDTGFPLEPGDTITVDSNGLEDMWMVGTEDDSLRWLAAAG